MTCFAESEWLVDIEDESYKDIHFIDFERKSNLVEILPERIYDKFTENNLREEAIVIYSSGTTGREKNYINSLCNQ